MDSLKKLLLPKTVPPIGGSCYKLIESLILREILYSMISMIRLTQNGTESINSTV